MNCGTIILGYDFSTSSYIFLWSFTFSAFQGIVSSSCFIKQGSHNDCKQVYSPTIQRIWVEWVFLIFSPLCAWRLHTLAGFMVCPFCVLCITLYSPVVESAHVHIRMLFGRNMNLCSGWKQNQFCVSWCGILKSYWWYRSDWASVWFSVLTQTPALSSYMSMLVTSVCCAGMPSCGSLLTSLAMKCTHNTFKCVEPWCKQTHTRIQNTHTHA